MACAIEHAFSSLCPPVLATVPVGQSTPPFTVVLNWMAALKKIKLPALRVLSPVLTVVCFLDEVLAADCADDAEGPYSPAVQVTPTAWCCPPRHPRHPRLTPISPDWYSHPARLEFGYNRVKFMAITIGTQLGSHEIIGLLGKGGMGEVYRARDKKLKREVAIKILPDEFARDPDRVSRFQREAEVLASLNHPNIAAIYDLQEANGSRFLVLELVEGDTLAGRLQRGSIPVDEALRIAKNICEALEAAHEKGVVHRDLKPGNVKITPEGNVKVLDFGLAKALEGSPANATMSNSPTLTLAGTNAGVILGTAAYMSPEQARGRAAGPRSDVFSFGCVLYEMLTGRQAFQGDEVSDVLASVLKTEPEFSLLPVKLNPRIHEVLRRCLQKNPKLRWHAVGDARIEIEAVLADPRGVAVEEQRAAAPKPPLWRRAIPVLAAIVLTAALTGIAVWNFKPSPPLL